MTSLELPEKPASSNQKEVILGLFGKWQDDRSAAEYVECRKREVVMQGVLGMCGM